MSSIDLQNYIDTNVLTDLVNFFNALDPADKVFESHHVPTFQPKVVDDGTGTLSTVFGDVGTAIVLAQFTYVYIGSGETATTIDFLELSRHFTKPASDLTTRVLSGSYVGDQPLLETVAGSTPIIEWIKNLSATELNVALGELLLFSVQHWSDNGLSGTRQYFGPNDSFNPSGLELVETTLFVWIGGEGNPITPTLSEVQHIVTVPRSTPSNAPVANVVDPSTSYVLSNTNASNYIRVQSSNTVTVSVPSKSSVNWKIGTEIHLEQAGLGQVSIIGEDGVTIQAASSFNLKTREQHAVITLKCVADNTWTVFGLLEQV